jgi:hypothetical protein
MGKVVAFKKPRPAEKFRGQSLCRHGRHKWVVEKDPVFDVKQGRLVTRYRCSRCGKVRVQAR